MDSNDLQTMREAVAKAYGFQLYVQYEEQVACAFFKKDISTLKRWRKKKLIRFVKLGEREIRYFGYQIADMLIKGMDNG